MQTIIINHYYHCKTINLVKRKLSANRSNTVIVNHRKFGGACQPKKSLLTVRTPESATKFHSTKTLDLITDWLLRKQRFKFNQIDFVQDWYHTSTINPNG